MFVFVRINSFWKDINKISNSGFLFEREVERIGWMDE